MFKKFTNFLNKNSSDSSSADEVQEISVQELKEIMDRSPDAYVLDVRETEEWEIAHIEGAVFKSFNTFEQNYQDVPKDRPIYIHCKVGGRSMAAAKFLKTKGYGQVFNVRGGIDAWAREIDKNMRRY